MTLFLEDFFVENHTGASKKGLESKVSKWQDFISRDFFYFKDFFPQDFFSAKI